MDNEIIMEEPILPTEDETDWDEERRKEEAARLAPYEAAARQRKESAQIVAEHDNMLSDILFEMTMNEFNGN